MADYENLIGLDKTPKTEKTTYKEVTGKKLEDVIDHKHNGVDSERVKPENLTNSFIKIVSTAPTEAPKRYVDNIQMISNGDSSLLYVWDNESSVWIRFNYYTP
jgi:hypothetical protein